MSTRETTDKRFDGAKPMVGTLPWIGRTGLPCYIRDSKTGGPHVWVRRPSGRWYRVRPAIDADWLSAGGRPQDNPSAKTVRVRILVVTDEAGKYNAAGWLGGADGVKDIVLDGFEPEGRERLTWVEADVHLPEPVATVEGEVTT